MPEIQVKDKLVTVEELGFVHNAGVTGVKGNAENLYRTGNVSLTPANIGALPDNTTFVGGVKGNAESSYRSGQVNLTPANIGAVDKAGDTMTGDLTVAHSLETNVASESTTSGITVCLTSRDNGYHGVYSSGYNSGDGAVTDEKYLIVRKPNGKVEVKDHYDKDAIDSKFAAIGVSSLFTVNSTNCDLRFAKRTGNVIMLSLFVKTGVANDSALVTSIDSSILPAQLDYVAPLYANDGKLIASGSVWIEYNNLSKISYYGDTTTVGGTATITYIIG